ncbi:MAG: VWA domain-containing protein [Gammaproteobacteria bacterium]|nr:VWA domain-containing protein [Gammaproteobacteria bacterium]
MKFERRELNDTNISFLDVITCAFGAVILLMMITKIEIATAKRPEIDPRTAEISGLQRQLFAARDAAAVAAEDSAAKQRELAAAEAELAKLEGRIAALTGRLKNADNEAAMNAEIAGKLKVAQQELTDEMRRLQARRRPPKDNMIGGIPVDSEYIVFVIDTSGSMFNYAWPKVLDQIMQTLQVYPHVKGIQIMSDQGTYLFQGFAGQWMSDSPELRRQMVSQLGGFNVFSESSPSKGIYTAMEQLYRPGTKMSLFVYGDEFTGKSIKEVVDYVHKLNHAGDGGAPLIRIHAVGFPTQFANAPQRQTTGIRFAALMREITGKNGGTFVGLNAFR